MCQNNNTLWAGRKIDMHTVNNINSNSILSTLQFNRRLSCQNNSLKNVLKMNEMDLYKVITQKIVETILHLMIIILINENISQRFEVTKYPPYHLYFIDAEYSAKTPCFRLNFIYLCVCPTKC